MLVYMKEKGASVEIRFSKVAALLMVLTMFLGPLPLSTMDFSGQAHHQATGPGSVSAETVGRSIIGPPSAMPPKTVNGKGELLGDWVIKTASNEWLNLSFETVKIHGNVTVKSGSRVTLDKRSMIWLMYSASEHYTFEVQEGADLYVLGSSTIKTEKFLGKPTSNIDFETSYLYVGGNLTINSDLLKLSNSLVSNIGMDGTTGRPGVDALLTIHAKGSSFSGSTISSKGGNGAAGAQGIAGTKGGDSITDILNPAGVITQANFTIQGGNGGVGYDSRTTYVSPGGMGGTASASIRADFGADHSIKSSSIYVLGGVGGKGGNGVTSSVGGDGGRGELGGGAYLYIQGKDLLVESSHIEVRGGAAGKGGDGGTGTKEAGGNGGAGSAGGNTRLQMEGHGEFNISDSFILTQGGEGGRGGFFGQSNSQAVGNPGDGGNGGDSTLIVNVDDIYYGKNSDLWAQGGAAGRGGLGFLVGGAGGDGGGGTMLVNTSTTSGTFFHTGSPEKLSNVGGCGGDGADGGYAVGIGTSGGSAGRGGSGGPSLTTITAIISINFRYSNIKGCKSKGGNWDMTGARPGNPGYPLIWMQSNLFDSEDGTAEWEIEGFNGTSQGILKNTTVTGPERCFVAPEQRGGTKCDVYWDLKVGITGASASERWVISLYRGLMTEGSSPPQVCTLTGSNLCPFLDIHSETVDYRGSDLFNFTVHAVLPDSHPPRNTSAIRVLLTSNKIIYLKAQGIWAPHIVVTMPEENNTLIRTWNYAPCRPPNPQELAANVSAPGCYKLQGDAWVDDRNEEGQITDVKVIVSNENVGTFILGTTRSNPPVVLKRTSGKTGWSLNWIADEFNYNTLTFTWPEGNWKITVLTFDGLYWSNNTERGGKDVFMYATLQHQAQKIPPELLFAGNPVMCTYQYYESGCKVTFNDAKITFVPKQAKIIRMEWYYESDSQVDWAFVPTDCGLGQTCAVPQTEHIYTQTGFKNAYFCVVDSLGRKFCDSKQIQVDRTVPPAKPAWEDAMNLYFPYFAILFILIMVVAILYNVANRKRIEKRYEELTSTHRIEIHANTCDRCGDPLQEGSTACKRCDATDYLSSIQQVILEIKGSGVNVIDAEGMLEDAVNLYDQGQYEPAKQKAYEAQIKANELRGKYVETTEMISQWEGRINKIKEDAGGIKLEQCEAETTVYHARLALGRGDFQMVQDYLSKIDPQIEAMKEQVKLKVVENRLGVVEKMIANVQTRGIKVLEAEDILRRAKETFASGDIEAAKVQAERAEKAIKRTNMMFIDSSERITQVEERMTKADKKGEADVVAQGRTALEKMKAAFLDGLYDNVLEIWKDIDKVLPPLRVAKKMAWEKEATRLTVEGSADAKAEAEERPSAAMAADIEKAEAKAAAEAKLPTQAEAAELLQKCYDRIMLARQSAIETTDADELYNDARKELEAGHYDVASDYSTNAIFLMEELLQVMGVKLPVEEKKPEPVPEVPKVEEKPVEVKPKAEEDLCPSCGKKVKARWATCPYCGVTLTTEAAPQEKPVEEIQGYGPVEKRPTMPYGPEGKVDEVKTQEYLPQETRTKEYIGGETTEGYKEGRLATKEYQPEQPEIHPELPEEVTPEVPKVEEKPVEVPVPEVKPEAVPPTPAVPDKVKCLICGRDVKSKWKTCPYCGATLGEGTMAAPVPVTAPPPAEAKPKCPGCGKDVKAKWKTCPYCGAVVAGAPAPAPEPEPKPTPPPDGKPKCPNCGKDVKPKWKTCPYCGASI
jgi:hypothetical protein